MSLQGAGHHSPCVYEEDIELLEWIEGRMGDLHCCPNTNGTCSKIKSVIKQRIDELKKKKEEEKQQQLLNEWEKTSSLNPDEINCLTEVFKLLKKWEKTINNPDESVFRQPRKWHKPRNLYRLSPSSVKKTDIDANWPEGWIKEPGSGFSPSSVDSQLGRWQEYPFIIAYSSQGKGWYLRVSTALKKQCADILYDLLMNKKFGNEQWQHIESQIKSYGRGQLRYSVLKSAFVRDRSLSFAWIPKAITDASYQEDFLPRGKPLDNRLY